MANQQIRQDVAPRYHNLTPSQLIELALQRGEERLADTGAQVVETGAHRGRSPKDRFIVREPSTDHLIDWDAVNQPFEPARLAVPDAILAAGPQPHEPTRVNES